MYGARVVPAVLLLLALGACTVEKVEPLTPPGTSSLPSDTASVPAYTPSPDPTLAPVGPAAAWTQRYDVRRDVVATGDVALFYESGKSVRAVRRADGREVWHRPMRKGTTLLSLTPVAAGVVVRARHGQFQESVDVIDPANGRVRWSTKPAAHAAVYQDAIYLDTCRKTSQPCTITSRDVRTGKVRWTIPWRGVGGVSADAIGVREGSAPVAGRYLAAHWGIPDSNAMGFYRVLETATGKALPVRLETSGWSDVAVGNLLVSTDHDGIAGCGVRVRAADVRTGRSRQLAELQSAKKSDGGCADFLANWEQEQGLLGSGSRFAAVNGDRAVLYDLATAKVAWTAATAGAPVDGDDRSLLVRRYPDKGALTLLDLADGRARWTAPDPGTAGGEWTHWHTAVTHRLVAVDGYQSRQEVVVVHDAATGRQLGRIRGKLAGAGADWVATSFDGVLSYSRY